MKQERENKMEYTLIDVLIIMMLIFIGWTAYFFWLLYLLKKGEKNDKI